MDSRLERNIGRKVDEMKYKSILERRAGVDTSYGFNMPASFEDSSIIRQAAEFLARQGATTMTIRDTTGALHMDFLLTDALLLADEMGAAYMAAWNKKELKLAEVNAGTDVDAVKAITWD